MNKGKKMKISKYQKELMQHTISGHDRNWFGTGLDCKDAEEFEKLVDAGYATKETPPTWMGDDVIYRLTSAGRNIAEKKSTRKNKCQI